MASSTRVLVASSTLACPLDTRETVCAETPARRATSTMDGRGGIALVSLTGFPGVAMTLCLRKHGTGGNTVPMAGITKRVTRLSDGRELIYFDDADTSLPRERPADARPPEPRPAVPTLRQDPLTGEWISIAAARQNRAFLPPAELDPLAPSTPGNLTEIPGDYDVAVF